MNSQDIDIIINFAKKYISDPVKIIELQQKIAAYIIEHRQDNILQIANALSQCIKTNNIDWQEKHEKQIIDILLNALPHGSGIDADWHINITDKHILCCNSYHNMNSDGYYTDWIDFTVKIKTGQRDIFGNLIYDVVGRFGRDQDLRDNIYQRCYELDNL